MKPLQLGVVFPQTEIGDDPAAVRDYAQAVQDLGYDFLVTSDPTPGITVTAVEYFVPAGPSAK